MEESQLVFCYQRVWHVRRILLYTFLKGSKFGWTVSALISWHYFCIVNNFRTSRASNVNILTLLQALQKRIRNIRIWYTKILWVKNAYIRSEAVIRKRLCLQAFNCVWKKSTVWFRVEEMIRNKNIHPRSLLVERVCLLTISFWIWQDCQSVAVSKDLLYWT